MVNKKAFAKINLTLEILDKREDGYHNIRSVMQKVSLCDNISFEILNEERITLSCSVDVCAEKDNLAYKAAECFLAKYKEKTGKTFGVKIHIDKTIPDKAGLAGGSADCACVLDFLFENFGGLSYDDVEEIAASLGSDINFCLDKYRCALCTDRGIVLEKCKAFKSDYVLICVPENGMKTSDIYRAFDENPVLFDENPSVIVRDYLNGGNQDKIYSHTVNAFAPICESVCSEISEIKKIMRDSGALASQMSGSGSSVYGIFKNGEELENCYSELSEKFKKCYKCRTLVV